MHMHLYNIFTKQVQVQIVKTLYQPAHDQTSGVLSS